MVDFCEFIYFLELVWQFPNAVIKSNWIYGYAQGLVTSLLATLWFLYKTLQLVL